MAADNTVNLIVNQKADFSATFTVKENNTIKNLTGYTPMAEYKTDYSALDNTAKSFTITSNNVAGTITLALSYEDTAALQQNHKYFYDLVLINDSTGFRTRVIEGSIKVSPGVTI